MDNVYINRKAVRALELWDPFSFGPDAYETETADVVAALQGTDDPIALAKIIQAVYEMSFEQWIPIEECKQMANQLIAIKFEAKCNI